MFSSSHFFFFFFCSLPAPILSLRFYFVCKCSQTRSVILTSLICIRPSISVLLLFAGYISVLNKSFLLFRTDIMSDL
jgi:hypothetical protein